jgi:4'-phosphopantetheinyl transferase
VIPLRPVLVHRHVVAAACAIAELRGAAGHAADLEAAHQVPAPRRTEHLAARALLRRLVAEVAGAGAASSPLGSRPGGRPYLTERPDLSVSISHTGGWVAVAVHPGGAVGIDAQRPVSVGDGLLRRCCTPSARTELAGLPDGARDTEFAWIWAVQEACVKATGAGIAGRPWTIPVEVGQRDGRWRAVHWWALRDVWPIPVGCALIEATL